MKSKNILDVYWGIVLVGIGALLLAGNLGYLEVHFNRYFFRTYWPVLLVLFGVAIVLKSWLQKKES